MDALKAKVAQTFDGPGAQSIVAGFFGAFAHLDACATVVAIAVLLFQLKIAFYKGKAVKLDYEQKREGLKKEGG